MSIYSLPEIKIKKSKKPKKFSYFIILIIVSLLFGIIGGVLGIGYVYPYLEDYLKIDFPEKIVEKETVIEKDYIPQTSHEEKVISAVKEASPSVVSIIVTKDLPVVKQYYYDPFEGFFDDDFFRIPEYRQEGTEKQQVGGGTGFLISEGGMVLTNRHVVSDQDAEYTVLNNEGEQFPAEVLARDPVKDLAVIQINSEKTFKPLVLGDSNKLETGQTVIAIGNALGEFQNTISTGVVSGLKRNVVASGGGQSELLENLIQTDAAINSGNSGGPLLNLRGEVIGINVAMSQSAENIGFAIPVNEAKRGIDQVKETGEIVYPFIGIYYTLITSELAEDFELPVSYGAWIGRDGSGNMTEEAIFSGSAAEEAGLRRDDIITKIDNEKINEENSLAELILNYDPGNEISLTVVRNSQEIELNVVLGKR
jgi:serine protease Do